MFLILILLGIYEWSFVINCLFWLINANLICSYCFQWALFHEESPQNNQMLSHKEALSLFNFTATFKRSSDFPLTTQYIPNKNYFFSRKPVSIEEKNRLFNFFWLKLFLFSQSTVVIWLLFCGGHLWKSD